MPPSVIDLIDNERDGAVSRQIWDWRAQGLSIESVAFRLHEVDVHVTSKTVQRWLDRNKTNGDS